jgi:hypothetical protein
MMISFKSISEFQAELMNTRVKDVPESPRRRTSITTGGPRRAVTVRIIGAKKVTTHETNVPRAARAFQPKRAKIESITNQLSMRICVCSRFNHPDDTIKNHMLYQLT